MAGPSPRRVTQHDIARAAGVHRSTVSMALRNHPEIPAATRKRILRLAEKAGYAPDPMLSALAAYRSGTRPATFHGTLGWIVNSRFGFNWRERPHFHEYHLGAVARARALGYQLEVFDLASPRMTPGRIAAILRARNIFGVLLCPQPQPDTAIDFPWEQFSAVTFGYTLAQPQLHSVAATHYRATLHTLRELVKLGYRRIGLALRDEHSQRTDHNHLAGYLVGLDLHPQLARLPVLGAPYEDANRASAWLKAHQPDAVIACLPQFLTTLRQLRVAVPGKLGFACPGLAGAGTTITGIVENNARIGAAAVDYVASMIQRGERGVPAHAERILVEGTWQPGATVRRLPTR